MENIGPKYEAFIVKAGFGEVFILAALIFQGRSFGI